MSGAEGLIYRAQKFTRAAVTMNLPLHRCTELSLALRFAP
jgi:hypothetical protein